jgi:hypothetical protein
MARELIDNKDKKLIDQWLKNNEVTVCEAGAITEDIEYTFGSKKKKKKPANAK